MPVPQKSFVKMFNFPYGEYVNGQIEVMERVQKKFGQRIVCIASCIAGLDKGLIYVELMYPIEMSACLFNQLKLKPCKLVKVRGREHILKHMKEYDEFWHEEYPDRELEVEAYAGSFGKVILGHPHLLKKEAYKVLKDKFDNRFMEALDKLIEK